MPYKNKADQDASNRRYYHAHKTAIKAYAKQWFMENRARTLEGMKQWRAAHPEKMRAYKAKWKAKNKEKVLVSERLRRRKKRLARKGKLIAAKTPAQIAQRLLEKADRLAKNARYGIEGKFNVERI